MRRWLAVVGIVSAMFSVAVPVEPAEAAVPRLSFTQTGCEGYSDSVARLYVAGLGRQPEQAGFQFWMAEYQAGRWPFPRIAAHFVDSVEFRARYATLTNQGFVLQLYRNVLGRDGEAAGVAFWTQQLNSGTTRATVLMRFAESPENIARTATAPPTLGPFNEGLSSPWVCIPPTPPQIPRPVTAGLTIDVLLTVVRVAPEETVNYLRSDWAHWSDLDRDGCDTRCEVLKRELIASVPALMGAPGYVSIYDGEVFPVSDTSSMDLDHVVALAEAARSGGQAWTPAVKEAFANDLGWHGSLVLVSASSNRSKGDKDPAEWMPPKAATDFGTGCRYLTDWLTVKYRWDLTIDPTERTAIVNIDNSLGC